MKTKIATAAIATTLAVSGGISTIPVKEIQETPVRDLIAQYPNIKEDIKGLRIAQESKEETYTYQGYEISISDIRKIDNGVQVYASATKKGKQVSLNGVEKERFKIINPPVLVRDTETTERINTGTSTQTRVIRTHREAPFEALKEVIGQNVVLLADDEVPAKGSVGNTTTTVYPDANPESTSVDGRIFVGSADGYSSWDDAHDATSGNADDSNATEIVVRAGGNGSAWIISRVVTLFDTSSIPDGDTISSATFSLYVNSTANNDNDGDDFIRVVQSSPASNTALVSGDYDGVGAVDNPTSGATEVDISGISTGTYTDWTLNATGLTWIDKTGITKLGLREGHDATDTPIASISNSGNEINASPAEVSGTTEDPKLVVVHAAAATEGFSKYGNTFIFD